MFVNPEYLVFHIGISINSLPIQTLKNFVFEIQTIMGQTNFITENEIRLITDPDKVEMPFRLIYRVLFFSALRCHELLNAQTKHLQRIDGKGYLLLEYQKNKEKNELTPLREQDYISLREYTDLHKRQPEDYIFIGKRGKHKVQWLNINLKRHYQLVGINRHLSSHAFKRGRIVTLKNKGHDYAEIANLTRNKDIGMLIRIYDKLAKEHASELVEK